ncbi:hypothetical protein [Chitinophaga rhizophila]|uniref:Uncharacterized protein n=1 Tax=Chitinophaga rhizophila TaxID=2866212 RepID=A0ABS7GJQ4_9BACT|nr:hypothetical protein [Chitinophaga rhizophila]MBW8686984.1 hypothetical protein [Chitinophaga rhizophila]
MPSNDYARAGRDNAFRGTILTAGIITAVVGAPYVFALAEKSFWSIAIWASVPTNQATTLSVTGFAFNVLNPDPNSQVDFGGSSKAGSYANLLLKNKFGNVVQLIVEKNST